jgi:hypothetical protein
MDYLDCRTVSISNRISVKKSLRIQIFLSDFSWGEWGKEFMCPNGTRITQCQLCVEPDQGDGDDTAANNLNCKCSNGETLFGDGTNWGSWNGWTTTCDKGICALQTRVEKPQENGDDTALNDVIFTCCPL